MMNRKILLGLLFYLSIVILGHFSYGVIDNRMRFDLTESLFLKGSVQTSEYGPIKFAPLQPVLMIPTYALGYLAGKMIGQSDKHLNKTAYRVTSYLFVPIVVSIICVLYFTFLGELGFDLTIRLISTYLLLFGTLLLPYSRLMFAEPLNALFILSSLYFLYKSFHGNARNNLRTSFVLSGLLCLNNAVFFLYYLLMVIYASAYVLYYMKDIKILKRLFVESFFIFSVVVGLYLLYNHARYGAFLQFGYKGEGFTHPIVSGLYGFLFSIGRGLVIYTPLTIPCVIFFILNYHKLEFDRRYILGISILSFGIYLLIYSKWYSWEGGWCWGPRYLLPFIPAIHLVFPFMLTAVKRANRLARALFLLLCLFSIGINAYEYIHLWGKYEGTVLITGKIPYRDTVFIPEYSYLFNNWEWKEGLKRLSQFFVSLCVSSYLILFWFRKRFF